MQRTPRSPFSRTSQNAVPAKFARPRSDGTGKFSGNCDVASRNRLLQDGATNATRWWRLDPERPPPCRARGPGAEFGGSLATANFRESLLGELRRIALSTHSGE